MRRAMCLVMLLGLAEAAFADNAKQSMQDYAGRFAEYDAMIRTIEASDPDCTNYVQWVREAIDCKDKLRLGREIDPWLDGLAAASSNNWKILHASAVGHGWLMDSFHGSHEIARWKACNLMDLAYRQAIRAEVSGDPLGRLVEDYIDLLLHGRQNQPCLLGIDTLNLAEDEVESNPDLSMKKRSELVFYDCPPSYHAAANDGELVNWLIRKSVPQAHWGKRWLSRRGAADFAVILAGVHRFFPNADLLHEIADDQVMEIRYGPDRAVPRTLPIGYQYIPTYRELAEQGSKSAANTLGNIFINRFQFERAARYYEIGGSTNEANSIRSNYGRITACPAQVGNQPAGFDYTFRNGSEVLIEVFRISPGTHFQERVDQGKVTQREFGFLTGDGPFSIEESMQKTEVASWSHPLDPHPDHWDRTQEIELPLLPAGNYRICATMQETNRSERSLFLQDTLVLLNKVENNTSTEWNFSFLFADAATGQPLGDQVFHIAGWNEKNNRIENVLKGRTDRQGCYVFDAWALDDFDQKYILLDRESRGLIACRVPYDPGYYRSGDYGDRDIPSSPTIFCTTDRPVYHPGDTGLLKVAFGEGPDPLTLRIQGWKSSIPFEVDGAMVETLTLQPDRYGGAEGRFPIPDDAKPGRYEITEGENGKNVLTRFLIEEYNVPEYRASASLLPSGIIEVLVTDIEGRPCVNAEAHLTVGFSHRPADSWCPEKEYDFRFGRGYWWHGGQLGRREEKDDKKRYSDIGVKGILDEHGTLKVDLQDYDVQDVLDLPGFITANIEVSDNEKTVFKKTCRIPTLHQRSTVCCWLDKAFFDTSEKVYCHVAQETSIGSPVLDLFQVTGTNLVAIKQFSVEAESVSLGNLPSGLYEVQAAVGDNRSKPFRFTVLGGLPVGLSDKQPLRVVREKGRYESGETARILLQADRPGRSIYLFTRTVYSKPVVIHMTSTEQIISLPLSNEDVDRGRIIAMTIGQGEPCFSGCHIPVIDPDVPVGRLELEFDKPCYQPGDIVKLDFRALNGANKGQPCSIALSIYNKDLDKIAGGVQRSDVRQLFYKLWKERDTRHGYVEMYDNWPVVHSPRHSRSNRLMDYPYFNGGLPIPVRRFGEPCEVHIDDVPRYGHDYLCFREDWINYSPKPTGLHGEFPDSGTPYRTAYWNAKIETDAEGRAPVEVQLPEDPAQWKVMAWAVNTNYAACIETAFGVNTGSTAH